MHHHLHTKVAATLRHIRKELLIVGVLLFVALVVSGWGSTDKTFVSSEVKFADFSKNGLAIVPASCPSNPHVDNECDVPAGAPTLNVSCDVSGTLSITWTAVGRATSYPLRVDDTSSPWANDCSAGQYAGDLCTDSITSTSYTHQGTLGHTYSVWVHAANSNGAGSPSAVTLTCPPPAPALSGSCYNGALNISWTESQGATSYPIRIDNLSNPWANDCSVAQYPGDVCNDSNTAPRYTHAATVGDTYNIWAHGANSSGFGPAGNLTITCSPLTPTTAPVVDGSCDNGALNLSWTAVQGAATYRLRIDNISNPWPNNCSVAQYPGDLCTDSVTTTSYTHAGAVGYTYNVSVSAANSSGFGPSGSLSLTCQPPTPTTCDTTFKLNKFHVCYFDGITAPTSAVIALGQQDQSPTISSPVGAWTGFGNVWGAGAVGNSGLADSVSGVWRARVNFLPGTYTFHVITDDGAELNLEGFGNIINNAWVNQTSATQYDSSPITLTAGQRNVQLRWYENTGGAQASLWWDYSCTPDGTYSCQGNNRVNSCLTNVVENCAATGRSCSAGACVCPSGRTWNGTQCVGACTPNYFCQNGDRWQQDASCVDSFIQACSLGCSNGVCNTSPTAVMRFLVSPLLVYQGSTVLVAWRPSNVSSCTVSGGTDSWTGTTSGTVGASCATERQVSGTNVCLGGNWVPAKTSSSINGQTPFTIECLGVNASTISQRATVNIIPVFCEPGEEGC